jgi:hypothetical protein
MSFFGDLFGGGSNGNSTTVVNNTQAWPSWYEGVMKNFLNNANTIASTPYTANPNPRVAPMTDDQNSAYSTVRNLQGQYQPAVNYAQGLAGVSGAGFDNNAFGSYFNPYTSQVVNQIGDLAQRNLTENLLPAVNDSFIRGGQFGSRGNFDLTERALRDTQEAALNQQGQLLNQGFQQQVQNMQQGQQNQNAAAQTLGQLAQTGQQLGLQGAAAQEAAGSAVQQQGQKNLDVANQDFIDQRDWSKNNATWLSSLLQGNSPPTNSTSTSTGTTPSASPLTQVVGAIGGLGSLLGGLFKKDGGGVRRYADGGEVAGGATANGYPSEMEMDNAALAHIQAAGEAAMATNPNERDEYDNKAIQDYIDTFGVLPGHVSPKGFKAGDGQDADTAPNHRPPQERYAGGGKVHPKPRGPKHQDPYLFNDPSLDPLSPQMQNQTLMNDYAPGENPNPYVMPVAPPQLVLDPATGEYKIDGGNGMARGGGIGCYADGGNVGSILPSYEDAFADAFATSGQGMRDDVEDPERMILRLQAEFGMSEEDARAATADYMQKKQMRARAGYDRNKYADPATARQSGPWYPSMGGPETADEMQRQMKTGEVPGEWQLINRLQNSMRNVEGKPAHAWNDEDRSKARMLSQLMTDTPPEGGVPPGYTAPDFWSAWYAPKAP